MTPDVEPVTPPSASRPDPVVTDVVDLSSVPEPDVPTTPGLPSTAGRRERLRKVGAIAFIGTVLLGAGAVTLTRSPYFDARTIRVRGTSHVARADVLRIASITHETNVFTLDVPAAEARLERDPWIAEATITKHLPSRVVIDVHERVAVAVVESDGILRLVADDGTLLEAALPRAAADLPVIASTEQERQPSEGAVSGAARAVAAMPPTVRARIDGVSILADGQLRVDLSSGAEVAYGEAVDLSDKAAALGALLDYAADRGVSVISADLRVASTPTAVLTGGTVVAP